MTDPRPAAGFGTSLTHAPALDGVRALAIVFVLAQHWIDHRWMEVHLHLDPGVIGVRLFFVLSGLLITRSLLVSRFTERAPTAQALRAFYVRRTLRIFPLYYAMLLLLALTSPAFRQVWPWYVTYLQNVRMVLSGRFLIASHFWTLAIEEQFYLVWPVLLFALPPRRLPAALLVMAMLAVVWRAMGHFLLGISDLQIALFTPASLDSLALGGLLAWLLYERRRPRNGTLAWIGLGGTAIVAGGALAPHSLGVLLRQSGVSLAAFALVAAVAEQPPRPLAALLGARPLVYVGRISYGIYVYHLFVSSVVESIDLNWARFGGRISLVATELAATLAVAAFSWSFFERPINALKHRLAPRRTAVAMATTAV